MTVTEVIVRLGEVGVPLPTEIKKKISEKRRGMSFTEQHKNNISKSCKGRKFSDEHRRKLCASAGMGVSIDGVDYDSIKKASLALGIPVWTISRRIYNPEYPNYKKKKL